jgi:hypothetical protein
VDQIVQADVEFIVAHDGVPHPGQDDLAEGPPRCTKTM